MTLTRRDKATGVEYGTGQVVVRRPTGTSGEGMLVDPVGGISEWILTS